MVVYINKIILIYVIFRDLLNEIRRIKPGTVVHQMYVEASDIYAFPAKPQVSKYRVGESRKGEILREIIDFLTYWTRISLSTGV